MILMFQVYRQGVYGRGYVWIWNSAYSVDDWFAEDFESSCTDQEVLNAADGHLVLRTVKRSLSENVTISGLVGITNFVHNINKCNFYENMTWYTSSHYKT